MNKPILWPVLLKLTIEYWKNDAETIYDYRCKILL